MVGASRQIGIAARRSGAAVGLRSDRLGQQLARRLPDVSKLERFTGFRPRLPLARVISDVVSEKRAARGGA